MPAITETSELAPVLRKSSSVAEPEVTLFHLPIGYVSTLLIRRSRGNPRLMLPGGFADGPEPPPTYREIGFDYGFCSDLKIEENKAD